MSHKDNLSSNRLSARSAVDGDSRNLPDKNAAAINDVAQLIRTVKFGTIQIIIQDGYIVQIEKTEKIRLK